MRSPRPAPPRHRSIRIQTVWTRPPPGAQSPPGAPEAGAPTLEIDVRTTRNCLDTSLRWNSMRTADARAHLEDRIVRDPAVMGGEAVIRGTRVPLRTVLATLAEGATTEQVLADFPTLTAADVRAFIAFAAASAEEDLPVPALPTGS